MSLPSVSEIRDRISKVEPEPIRYALEAIYLYAGRVSEVIGHVVPSDQTHARGPKGTDARIDEVDGHEVVLFNCYTAKRDGLLRIIALPIDYEPWAKPLFNYYLHFGPSHVFPFDRQTLWKSARDAFNGLTYQIEKYAVVDSALQKRYEIPRHDKPFALHALRHLRASELVSFYHFNAEQLAAYAGWKFSTVTRATSVMDRYVGSLLA